jgi:hypothetical protein
MTPVSLLTTEHFSHIMSSTKKVLLPIKKDNVYDFFFWELDSATIILTLWPVLCKLVEVYAL